MAKQKGIITLIGTIGGTNFYLRKGEPTARIAGGGFNRKAIKHSPRMVRVREQNTEFGQCSVVNKVFKQAIRPLLIGYKDGSLHSRLMGLFMKIKDFDSVSIRGQRQVWQGMTTDLGKHRLKYFAFTPKRPKILPFIYGFDWNTLTFSVLNFNVKQVNFPANAHFFELRLDVICFDFESLTYQRVSAEPAVIDRDFVGDAIQLIISELPTGSGVCFAMARIAFYQEVHGERYLLAGDGAFGVEILGIRE